MTSKRRKQRNGAQAEGQKKAKLVKAASSRNLWDYLGKFGVSKQSQCVQSSDEPWALRQRLAASLGHDEAGRAQIVRWVEQCGSEGDEAIADLMCPLNAENYRNYSGTNDSVLRCLLHVPLLQTHLIDWILEFIPMLRDHEHIEDAHRTGVSLLGHLRWMDDVAEVEHVTSKLLQSMDACAPPLQRHYVRVLPDIVDDACHPMLLDALEEMMDSQRQCTGVIMETLSSLSLRSDLAEHARKVVSSRLSSAAEEHLPAMTRFLLQTTPAHKACELVGSLREQLSLGATQGEEQGTHCALLLDALRSGLRFQSAISGAALGAIRGAPRPVPLDLWLAVLLTGSGGAPAHAKAAVTAVRRRVKEGSWDEPFVRKCLRHHQHALTALFSDVIALADRLLRSPEPPMQRVASALLCQAFLGVREPLHRQSVLRVLISHIGSAVSHEVSLSLSVLLRIVESAPEHLKPFLAFVKAILDHMERLSLHQVRQAYRVLACLAVGPSGALDPSVHSHMAMLLRKQLSCPSPRYRRLGVVGSACLLARMSQCAPQGAPDAHERAAEVLRWVRCAALHSVPLRLLWLSEVTSMARHSLTGSPAHHPDRARGPLSPWLLKLLLPDCQADLQDKWTRPVQPQDRLKKRLLFDLSEGVVGNDEACDSYCMCVRTHVRHVSAPSDHLLLMGPSLEAVAALLRCADPSTDLLDIGLLLAMPVELFARSSMDGLIGRDPRLLRVMAISVYHTANWLRALINAFAASPGVQQRHAVVQRVAHLLCVESWLSTLLPHVPSLCLPSCQSFLCADVSDSSCVTSVFTAPSGAPLPSSSSSSSSSTPNPNPNPNPLHPPPRAPVHSMLWPLRIDVALVLAYKGTRDDQHDAAVWQLSPSTLCALLQWLLPLLHRLFDPVKKRLPTSSSSSSSSSPSDVSAHERRAALVVLEECLPALCEHVQRLVKAAQAEVRLTQVAASQTTTMVNQEWHDVRPALLCALEALQLLLSSPLAPQHPMLRLIQRYRRSSSTSSSTRHVEDDASTPLHALQASAFEVFSSWEGCATSPDLCVALLRLLQTCVPSAAQSRRLHRECASKLSRLAVLMVRTHWPQEEPKPKADVISAIITCIARHAEHPSHTLHRVFVRALGHCAGAVDELPADQMVPLLTTQSFPTVYKCVISEVAHSLSVVVLNEGDAVKSLSCVEHCVTALLGCVSLTAHRNVSSVLAACLRYGKAFVDHFVSKCIPFMSQHLLSHTQLVVTMLKQLQKATRMMQRICAHAKALRDGVVVGLVPQTKRSLERLLYRVEAVMRDNHLDGDISMGTLEHKTLSGQPMASQLVTEEYEEEYEEDEADDEVVVEQQRERDEYDSDEDIVDSE